MATSTPNPTMGITPLWPTSSEKPSIQSWQRWKITFENHKHIYSVVNSHVTLTDSHWNMIFRQCLGEEGQRHFDAMNLSNEQTVSAAMTRFAQLWGVQQNARIPMSCRITQCETHVLTMSSIVKNGSFQTQH